MHFLKWSHRTISHLDCKSSFGQLGKSQLIRWRYCWNAPGNNSHHHPKSKQPFCSTDLIPHISITLFKVANKLDFFLNKPCLGVSVQHLARNMLFLLNVISNIETGEAK